MPRPAITPLHERLRRVALGLEKRNLPHHQLRALADLDRMERPRSPRKLRRIPPERIAWYARLLAEITVAGSGDPVRGVFVDPRVAATARYYLTSLSDPLSREVIRQIWLGDPTGPLTEIVRQQLPADLRDQAVTLFLLGDFDRYVLADPSGALVETARAEGDPALRVQLATAARRWNRLNWAYRVAAVPERLLPEEWDAVIELLTAGERQEYLWQAISKAPLSWSARVLAKLSHPAGEHLSRLAVRYTEMASAVRPFELLIRLDAGLDRTQRCAFKLTADGLTLVAIGPREISLWSLAPASQRVEETRRIPARTLLGDREVAISPDGSLLAVAVPGPNGRPESVQWWRLPEAEPVGAERVRFHSPSLLAFAPDGASLLSVGKTSSRVWHVPQARRPGGRRLRAAERALFNGSVGDWPCLAMSPDGSLVAVGQGKSVRIRRWPDGTTIAHLPVARTGLTQLRELLISPQGDTVVVYGLAGRDGRRLVVASLSAGAPLAAQTIAKPVSQPVVTPDGEHLAVVEQTGLSLWRLPGCTRGDTPPADMNAPANLQAVISPDSRLLILRGYQRTELFELPSGRRLEPLELTNADLLPDPDGALLVGTARGGAIEVWRYRRSLVSELAERPINELTGRETEAFYGEYDDPADAALAELGAAVLRYLRRDRPRGL
ncbi:hypothetical protein [Kribbella sp. NPDC051718]|uniref:WD40 repeat domain-containing protein n=1 Tax=Kribbella sp. NPDC051718 TaxID=3155168 RepID=UPI003426F5D6